MGLGVRSAGDLRQKNAMREMYSYKHQTKRQCSRLPLYQYFCHLVGGENNENRKFIISYENEFLFENLKLCDLCVPNISYNVFTIFVFFFSRQHGMISGHIARYITKTSRISRSSAHTYRTCPIPLRRFQMHTQMCISNSK